MNELDLILQKLQDQGFTIDQIKTALRVGITLEMFHQIRGPSQRKLSYEEHTQINQDLIEAGLRTS